MASDEGGPQGPGPAYERAPEMPDRGIPGHFGHEKQLHSATGYNVVVDSQGGVYGTREPYNSEGRGRSFWLGERDGMGAVLCLERIEWHCVKGNEIDVFMFE